MQRLIWVSRTAFQTKFTLAKPHFHEAPIKPRASISIPQNNTVRPRFPIALGTLSVLTSIMSFTCKVLYKLVSL